MKTEAIYDAQLNVSKFYNSETINALVSKLSFMGKAVYNQNTCTIDILKDTKANVEDDILIRSVLRDWLRDLPANEKDIEILCDNINYIFNIAKLGYACMDKHIINIYLY